MRRKTGELMILKIEIYQTLSSGIKLGYKQVFVL